MPSADFPEITIDLSAAQKSAERVRAMFLDLRGRVDLSPYEYCKRISIAPTMIPHSHPQVTLNTFVFNEVGLLTMYLHEQMHWYVTWYSYSRPNEWSRLLALLRDRYPRVPDASAGGAQDKFSTYLHLVVNWLEIETAADFVDRSTVEQHVGQNTFYRWMYKTVTEDWGVLKALYAQHNLVPIVPATAMSAGDLALAARQDEALA